MDATSAIYFRVMHNIQSDPAWSWAAGATQQDLQSAKMGLDKFLVRSEFWKSFSIQPLVQLRKATDPTEALGELEALSTFKESLAAFEKAVKQVTAMQNARASCG
eukprot:989052-Alexandrium_andersonii.AAC.1